MSSSDQAGATGSSNATPRSVALVAAGQLSLMAFGGLLAVLIAQVFGKTRSTDAFFATYGVYSLGQVIASSLRFSVIPEIVDRTPRSMSRVLAGAVAIGLVIGVPVLVFADGFASVLAANDPEAVAPTSLRILTLAIGAQLVTAVLLAALAVYGRFGAIAATTGTAGLVTLGAFVALRPRIGIDAASAALGVSSLYMLGAAGLSARLAGIGLIRVPVVEGVRAGSTLLWSSATFFGPALAFTFAVSVATRYAPGEATVLAYAYVIASTLAAVTTYVVAGLRAPEITADQQRTAAALSAAVVSIRATIAIVSPILALVVIVGAPVLGWVLGDAFGNEDVRTAIWALLALYGWILATALGVFAVVELLARPARGTLACISVMLWLGTWAVAPLGYSVAGIPGIAGAISSIAVAASILQLRFAFGSEAGRLAARVGRWLLSEAVLLAVALTPVVAVRIFGSGDLLTLASGALSATLLIVGSIVLWPDERRLAMAVVSPRRASL